MCVFWNINTRNIIKCRCFTAFGYNACIFVIKITSFKIIGILNLKNQEFPYTSEFHIVRTANSLEYNTEPYRFTAFFSYQAKRSRSLSARIIYQRAIVHSRVYWIVVKRAMGVGHNGAVAIFTAHVGDAVDNFRSLAYENACNINLSGEARTSRPHPLGPRTRIRILNSVATKSLFKNGTNNFSLYSDVRKHTLHHFNPPYISFEWVLIILMQVLALYL